MGGAPMPSLGLSTGPSVADARSQGSSGGTAATGDFYFKQPPAASLIAQALPLITVGLIAWLAFRR